MSCLALPQPKLSRPAKGQLNILPVECMDIDSLGEAVVGQLVDSGKVTSLDDLYRLNASQLLELDGFAEKSANNLVEAIRHSKSQDFLENFVWFRYQTYWHECFQRFGSSFLNWRELANASKENFYNIEGIGEIMADSLVDFFSDTKNQLLLKLWRIWE